MQFLIEATKWLGITLAVVSAISPLVVTALSWLLNHPDSS
jgi:hypothetical protein